MTHDAAALSAWSTTAVEVQPDAAAETEVRAREEVGVDADLAGPWDMHAVGAVQRPPGDGPLTGSVYRLVVEGRPGPWSFTAGRLVRLDVRGFEPLDGVEVGWRGDGPVALRGWGGLLWDAETWKTGEVPVVGAELQWSPADAEGRPSRAVGTSLSAETRIVDDVPRLRAAAGIQARNAKGASALALVEGETGPDGGSRATVAGRQVFSPWARAGVEGRWEDLAPASATAAPADPVAWLGGDGYAVASAELTLGPSAVQGWASGGFVAQPDGPERGGMGRFGLRVAPGAAHVGAFGAAAGIGASRLAGGGGEIGWAGSAVDAAADAGVYRFVPLDGEAGVVWAARLRGRAQLLHGRVPLALAGRVETGSDRVLAAWVRGGLALELGAGGGR